MHAHAFTMPRISSGGYDFSRRSNSIENMGNTFSEMIRVQQIRVISDASGANTFVILCEPKEHVLILTQF